jgi:hypothetical protein
VASLGLGALGCGDASPDEASPAQDAGVDVDAAQDAGPTRGPLGVCRNPLPLLVQGQETGMERCEEGFVHRPLAPLCPSSLPRQGVVCPADSGNNAVEGELGCTTDAECGVGPTALCQAQGDVCACAVGCQEDAQCGGGSVCVCGEPVGRCVESGCGVDADCGPGSLCVASNAGCGVGVFACQREEDECLGDADCEEGLFCRLDARGSARRCAPGGCGD